VAGAVVGAVAGAAWLEKAVAGAVVGAVAGAVAGAAWLEKAVAAAAAAASVAAPTRMLTLSRSVTTGIMRALRRSSVVSPWRPTAAQRRRRAVPPNARATAVPNAPAM
jgi:hypothetical protein